MDEEQSKIESGKRSEEVKLSREMQDWRVDIAERYCTKDDLKEAKADFNERLRDTKHWIWYAIIPLVALIVTLVVLLIRS